MDILSFIEDLGFKSPTEIRFISKIYEWAMNIVTSTIGFFFTQLMLQIITPYVNRIKESWMFKIVKAFFKVAIEIVKAIVHNYLNFASPKTWVIWGVTILVIVLMFFSILFGRFGTFQGEILIDFEKMQEMNQDESEYTDLLNTAALREAFYDSISDTSFYQTFNLTDMDGSKIDLTAQIGSGIASIVSGKKYTAEDFYASKKCTSDSVPSCVYANGNLTNMLSMAGVYLPQMDNRYQVTDASKNPAKYLIQAESLGTYSDSFGLTSYFRDYWNREEDFSLSADFLYELNRWMYETDAYPSTEQIVYPEAFVQPVSFVHDYLRIQNDPSLNSYGDPYVYVTQRVTLEDIQEPTNEFYNKYEYEGLIKSLPSDIVYDYAILDLNSYEIMKDTASADSVNIGNPSQYATVKSIITYEDGTTDTAEEIMKLYWIVNPYYMDKHMSEEISSEKDLKDVQKYLDALDDNLLYNNDKKIGGKTTVNTNYYVRSGASTALISGNAIDPYFGPYIGMNVDASGNIIFDRKLSPSTGKRDGDSDVVYYYHPDSLGAIAVMQTETGTDLLPCPYVIDFYQSQTKLSGSGITFYDGEFVYVEGSVYMVIVEFTMTDAVSFDDYTSKFEKIDGIITFENNLHPTKHYQLAQIADEDGIIIASSRNLINKTYLKTKTVRASFRNSDEYWIGFEEFAREDMNRAGYVGGISNFFDATFRGQCVYMDEEGEDVKALYYCNGDSREYCERDSEIWEERKCSVISYYNQQTIAKDIEAKIKNWISGEDATMDAPAEAIYAILVEYENYLVETGTQGVQWEYKYYSNTKAEADRAMASFSQITTWYGFKFTDITGISNYFESDKDRYKDTFDTVVELNESRAVSTEYTPVAIMTGANDKMPPTGMKLENGVSWGWRLVPNGSGSYNIKIAYGEASYEFPDYYTDTEISKDAINQKLQDILDKETADKSFFNTVGSGLIGMLFNTDYGDVVYGKINFAYKWVKDASGDYNLEYDAAALSDFYTGIFLHASNLPQLSDYENVSGSDDKYQDIRNPDQAWNPDVEIFRPEATGDGSVATMKSCITKNEDGSDNWDNCGRITYQTDPEDYYAMELKSVRDYGLGSVLSYIEGKKVTFLSALAVTETYNIEGVQRWFEEYYKTECGLPADIASDQAKVATSGFFPSELLNDSITVELDGQRVPLSFYATSLNIFESIDDEAQANINGVTIETELGKTFLPSDLAAIADGLNDLQQTGNSIFKYNKNGVEYWFTVTYSSSANDVNTDANSGFVLMMKPNATAPDSKWVKTNINVVIPYITENAFFQIFKDLVGVVRTIFTGESYTDQMARDEATNQFFNPLGYYLAWFDYSRDDVSTLDKVWNFITMQDLVSKYDNQTAATLREIFNREKVGGSISKDDPTLADVSNVKTKFWASLEVLTWFADLFNIGNLFDGAGQHTNQTIWDNFYNSYYEHVGAIDLLDQSRSSKVYMIEEAVTFLGNFVYTYDTELLIAGDLYGQEKIVSDLIFADRYYVINNYIFAVPVYTSSIEWTDTMYSETYELTADDGFDGSVSSVETLIAANNPCAKYRDEKNYDSESHPIKYVFDRIVDAFSDTLYAINDKLNIVDLDLEGMQEWVLQDYCTSNYYYKTKTTNSVKQTYVRQTRYSWSDVLICQESDTSNNGRQAGEKTTCVKGGGDSFIGRLGYKKITVTYEQFYRIYNSLSSIVIDQYLVNGQYGKDGEYIIRSEASTSISSIEYQWAFKYGYATKSGAINEETMIHVDTYNEVLAVYRKLIEQGYSDTAAKLFIGLQIFDDIDGWALFNYSGNKVDFKKNAFHDSTDSTQDMLNVNPTVLEEYKEWCIVIGGDMKKCSSAAYGDTDHHYTVYSHTYIAGDEDSALWTKITNGFQDLLGTITMSDDMQTNLIGNGLSLFEHNFGKRYGFLMGGDRLNEAGELKSNVEQWAVLDDYGNMDTTNMKTSTTFIQMGGDGSADSYRNFDLSQTDLERIAQAIYDVYGADYTTMDHISLGTERATSVELVRQSDKRNNSWNWNTTLKGTDVDPSGKLDGASDISIESDGYNCYVTYYWMNNDVSVDDHDSNLNVSKDILENDNSGGFSANSFLYGHRIEFQHTLVNDWRLLFVGIDIAQYQNHGTPIALETMLWGSKKQISPVETGAYFNEQVYSNWLNRVTFNDGDTYAKEEYLLDYHAASTTYLYDYLTNFETYIPLGVMSDADLVARGTDAYTSIGSNANRSFSYTASYMSVIKEYLNTPGWQSIIDNYKTKPANVTEFLNSLAPTVNSQTIITEDTMTQYVAGLIETTIQYAPIWMVDYHIENNTDDVGGKILRERENYTVIADMIYHSLFASSTSDISSRKVKLALEDGTYHEFAMTYLGYGAILAYTNDDVTTNNVAPDIVGFGNVTLEINDVTDERLDTKKALEYVTVKFGKLLYKYGNVSSATMAYFYGEEYWDEMLKTARIEGLSTGPEWHNDDESLIKIAVDNIRDKVSTDNGTFKLLDYSEDYLADIFTAEVVDYNLSYVSDSAQRIFLIRNTTSALGSAVSSIGSLSEMTRDMYESLMETVEVWAPDDETLLFQYSLKELDDLTRRLNLDLGVLMAIIMSSSDGDPCAGIGVCETNGDGSYTMTTIHESNTDGNKLGLFALAQGTKDTPKTYSSSFSESVIDYAEGCVVDGYDNWVRVSYDRDTKMCSTSANVSFTIKPTASIGHTNWLLLNKLNLTKIFNSEKDKHIEAAASVMEYFEDENSIFVDGGREAVLYMAMQLSKIYAETDKNAIDTIFIYFNGKDALDDMKVKAVNNGYGADWYSYYVKKNSSNNSNNVIKTLNYYDATLEAENVLIFETNDPAVYVDDNLTGKTIIRTFFDEEYRKNITETKTYENCSNTTLGVCTTTTANYALETVNQDACNAATLVKKYESKGQNAKVNDVNFTKTNVQGDVLHDFEYRDVPADDCETLLNQIETAINAVGKESSTFTKEGICDSSKIQTTTTYTEVIDMTSAGDWRFPLIFGKDRLDNASDLKLTCAIMSGGFPSSRQNTDTNRARYIQALENFTGFTYYVGSSRETSWAKCTITRSVTRTSAESYVPENGTKTASIYTGYDPENPPKKPERYDADGEADGYRALYVSYSGLVDLDTEYTFVSASSYYPKLSIKFETSGEELYLGTEKSKIAFPDDYSIVQYGPDITNKRYKGNCSYQYSFQTSTLTQDRACVATEPNTSVEFVYNDPDPEKGMFHCSVKTIKRVDYDNEWNLSINGFSVSAFALFGDTTTFNEYAEDKVALQNSGVEVYVKDGSSSRNDVDVIITSTLATEDNFNLTAIDYSIFAFFQSFINYADDSERSWIAIYDDLTQEGTGTKNDFVKNEIWDFPVLAKLRNPLTGNVGGSIEIVERFGMERDLVNGGTKLNNGLTIEADWGTPIYNVIAGKVVSTGYNHIYGNYVEVQANIGSLGSDIISSAKGDRYQITGFKIIYGYLLSQEDGGYIPDIGSSVVSGSPIGKAGNGGRSTGDQVYMSIYIEANLLSDTDDSILQTGWLPVDPEKYYTTQWSGHKISVKYNYK